jgi:hypothetical protein
VTIALITHAFHAIQINLLKHHYAMECNAVQMINVCLELAQAHFAFLVVSQLTITVQGKSAKRIAIV